MLREESDKLRNHSLASAANPEQEEMGSPGSDISAVSTTKSGSRASSSHTDSAESGIDVNMPSDDPASLLTTNKKPTGASLEMRDTVDSGHSPESESLDVTQHYAVAEVHREMEPDSLELQAVGYSNTAFVADTTS